MTRLMGAAIAALVSALAAGETTVAEKISNTGGLTTFDRPASPLSGAQVVAAKGPSSASVKISRILSHTDGADVLRFSTWSLTASSPLNKNADDTDVATLDGLTNAASIEFAYSSFRAPGRRTFTAASVQKADEICKRLHDAKKDAAGASPVPQSGCDANQVAIHGSATDRHEYDSLFWQPDEKRSNWLWGANAKVGYQNFEFVDASSATKTKQDETPWSFGGFVGYNPDAWRAIVTLSFKYQHAFKEGDNGVVCPASTGAGVTCTTGPFGSPKQVTKKLLSLEGRKDFGVLGAGLTATYDFESKVWGFELPVHFVKDKDGNLIAGVKVGWRDDTDVFTGTVFVGTTFGLLK